jgi:Tol biopolymer transport system component
MAFSNDGNFLCYTSGGSLFLKSLAESGKGVRIDGPWDPRQPSFSADGNWIVFEDVSTSSLMKIPVVGGDAQVVFSIEGQLRGFHYTKDEIIFCDNNAIYTMDLNGGSRKKIYPRDTTAFATFVYLRQLLPDNKTLLYEELVNQSPVVKVVRLDGTKAPEVLIDQATYAQYLESGHIVFLKQGSLQIIPFDLSSNTIIGPSRVITSGIGNFAINNRGTLVYSPAREIQNSEKHLVWIDFAGKIEKISKEPDLFLSPRISSNGRQIAVDLMDGGSFDITIYNPVLGTATNFITKDSTISPIWAPDNNTIAYFKFGDPQGVFVKPVDNSYPAKLLFETDEIAMLGNWSDDGRYLVFSTAGDIAYFDFEDSTVNYLDFINAEDEFFPALSPDGKWLAYTSDDDKMQDYVYVVPFPGPGRAHRVSVNEGHASVWAPDMKAIYFVGEDEKGTNVSKADITISPEFSSSPPQVLFYGHYTTLYRFANTGRFQFGNSGRFDIHPDGRRFLMEQSNSETFDYQDLLKLEVIVNWPELLKEDI